MTDTPEVNDIPAILARADAATTGPWKVAPMSAAGDDWLITIMEFRDITREALLLTTDRVHASEMNGASIEDDAEFCAHSRTDVPNMAAEILSLRAQVVEQRRNAERYHADMMGVREARDAAQKRLDVLEELARTKRLFVDHVSIYISDVANKYPTLTEAADAELSRREKENG